MRSDLPGMSKRRLLLSNGRCFRASEKGLRRKKSVHGNTVNQDIVQINMKVTKYSPKPIEDHLLLKDKTEPEKKEVTEETKK